MEAAGSATDQDQMEKLFSHIPYAPYDPAVDVYLDSRVFGLGYGSAVPMEYSGWREEQLSWKETCYLHAGLNPAPTFTVKGPDAIRFYSDVCVNSLTSFPVGTLKHAVMCNDQGLVVAHGTLWRVAEDEFTSNYLAPYAAYKFYTGGYQADGWFVEDSFLLQVAGPAALQAPEAATGECLHDIQFLQHRMSRLADVDVRIGRIGMAGTLAYEVHGPISAATDLYDAIMRGGKSFGIKKIGFRAFSMNHTEAGFPQAWIHFPLPWADDPGLLQFLHMPDGGFPMILGGSMGTEMKARYRNPVELGWGNLIKFDHDFIGREALEKEIDQPRRAMVTLSWNADDLTDIYASQYQTGEPYMPMGPSHFGQEHGLTALYADQVVKDGKVIGCSSGRTYSYYYREMLSLCSINVSHYHFGDEVAVIWGNPGSRQKEVRARVSRFPYLNENRNEECNVEDIDCCVKGH
jgi:glycine cleavage system aminomethyltransferase T